MTGFVNQSAPEERLDEAASWHGRLQASDADETAWTEFTLWLEAAPENHLAYDQIELVAADVADQRAALLQTLPADPAPNNVVDLTSLRKASARPLMQRRLLWVTGIAAALAAVIFVVGQQRPHPATPVATPYETMLGQSRTLTLTDGTSIHMNTATKLRVQMLPTERRVELAQGEAYFDVAKDSARPFLISVGDQQVRIVGTAFNILRHNGAVSVTVSRGIVTVSGRDNSDVTATRLTPGMQLVHQEGSTGSIVRHVVPSDVTMWRSGKLVYDDQRLADISTDLVRYFAKPIHLSDTATENLRFSGVLILDNQKAVVRRLEQFMPVKASWSREAVTLRAYAEKN